MAQFRKYEQEMMQDIVELGRAYDTSEAELRAHFEALSNQSEKALLRFAHLRSELRQVLTAEEWHKVTEPWKPKEKKPEQGDPAEQEKGEG